MTGICIWKQYVYEMFTKWYDYDMTSEWQWYEMIYVVIRYENDMIYVYDICVKLICLCYGILWYDMLWYDMYTMKIVKSGNMETLWYGICM